MGRRVGWQRVAVLVCLVFASWTVFVHPASGTSCRVDHATHLAGAGDGGWTVLENGQTLRQFDASFDDQENTTVEAIDETTGTENVSGIEEITAISDGPAGGWWIATGSGTVLRYTPNLSVVTETHQTEVERPDWKQFDIERVGDHWIVLVGYQLYSYDQQWNRSDRLELSFSGRGLESDGDSIWVISSDGVLETYAAGSNGSLSRTERSPERLPDGFAWSDLERQDSTWVVLANNGTVVEYDGAWIRTGFRKDVAAEAELPCGGGLVAGIVILVLVAIAILYGVPWLVALVSMLVHRRRAWKPYLVVAVLGPVLGTVVILGSPDEDVSTPLVPEVVQSLPASIFGLVATLTLTVAIALVWRVDNRLEPLDPVLIGVFTFPVLAALFLIWGVHLPLAITLWSLGIIVLTSDQNQLQTQYFALAVLGFVAGYGVLADPVPLPAYLLVLPAVARYSLPVVDMIILVLIVLFEGWLILLHWQTQPSLDRRDVAGLALVNMPIALALLKLAPP